MRTVGHLSSSVRVGGHSFSAYALSCMNASSYQVLVSGLRISRLQSRRNDGSSDSSSSISSDESDGDGPDSNTQAADQVSPTEVIGRAFNPATVTDLESDKEQERIDVNSKSPDAKLREFNRARSPTTDSTGMGITSLDDPYVFLQLVSVAENVEAPTNGGEGEMEFTDSANGQPKINPTHTFRYEMRRLQKMFLDTHLRLKEFIRHRTYKKCPSRTLQEFETISLQTMQDQKISSLRKGTRERGVLA